MDMLMALIALAAGLVVGVLLAMLLSSRRLAVAQSETASLRVRSEHLASELEQSRTALAEERRRGDDLASRLAVAETDGRNLRARLEEEGLRLQELQARLRTEFENLANRIFEEKSTKFLAQNQEHLGALLDPLKQRLGEFKERIEIIHTEETKTSAALREQLQHLKELNQQITNEAGELTRALKGESKTQGSWGELVLEKILEKSGLQKGSEYEVQSSYRNAEGSRLMPDVVIHLPEGKHIIIDAKVSLTAYERCANASDDATRQTALREHVLSVRRHVEELARKDYSSLPDLQSPDFVLMFVPIESALHLALQGDAELYGQAFEKNVVLVSSSTLLIALRAIESVWRRHKQTLNALEIARQAGGLYDQFARFTESLKEIGQRLDQARESYDAAMGRLSSGRGNLVKRVSDLQKLGARAEKQLDQTLVQKSDEQELPLDS